MSGYYENKKERYWRLKTDAIYQVQNNLLFRLSRMPEHYLKERKELVELIKADHRESLKLALKILRKKYKNCPAKGSIEAMLSEYY
ncbi:hypothetical protein HYV89_05205 [Candidatus Woesearchaeota archaeon]|nr:hypothetical protein [Candidatus Woesearchaeota archaeon]